VSRSALLLPLLLVLGCSDLTEGAGGVVGLEITQPALLTIEVGETLPLTARALDKDGNTVNAAVTWRAPDPTLTVDPATGIITGVAPGSGRVQAFAGELSSGLVQFTVIARADTLIVTDSVFTVAPGGAASPPLVAQLQSFNPAGPLANRPIVYAITDPPEVIPHLVELPGGVVTDTLSTGTDGAVSGVTLNRVALAQPDTAIVEVRAFRTRGAPVPGSGQRFIVIFQ
jgi:Bacterial Ig-like domain (group 2)